MMITPNMMAMESETVLTQYIIKNWTLAYNNKSNIHIILEQFKHYKKQFGN